MATKDRLASLRRSAEIGAHRANALSEAIRLNVEQIARDLAELHGVEFRFQIDARHGYVFITQRLPT